MPSQARRRLHATGAMVPPSEQRRSHIGGTTARKRRKTNVIESDDDVDVEDVDNDALPAKLGKCSKGTDALTASPAFD